MSQTYRSPDGRTYTLWESVAELLDALIPAYGSRTVEQRKERGWIFRGQSDAQWDLAPTLYRKPYTANEIEKRKNRTEAFVNALRENAARLGLAHASEDELYAIAQHYGFPTAHLDFTYNLEVAAYFASAVNPSQADVGVIYGFNVQEYQEMRNPFAVWGISQEQAEQEMREAGLMPLPPLLKVIQLENVPRILKQEAIFLEVHEEHLDTLMDNCAEIFYFKQGVTPYSGSVQPHMLSLPDRSSFNNDLEYERFLSLAKLRYPQLFETTPYIGQDTLFPEDDEINRFVKNWQQEVQETGIPAQGKQRKEPYAVPPVKIMQIYPTFQSLLFRLPADLRTQLEMSWVNIPMAVEKAYVEPACEQGIPGKYLEKLKQHVTAAWELDHLIQVEKYARLESTEKWWEPFAARLWDIDVDEVTSFDFETQRPNRQYFRGALPLKIVGTILRRAMPELLERVSMAAPVKEELLGFSDEQMLNGPYIQLSGMLADRFLEFLTEEERWDLWVSMVVPVGSVFALEHTKPFLNPNLVYRCGFP